MERSLKKLLASLTHGIWIQCTEEDRLLPDLHSYLNTMVRKGNSEPDIKIHDATRGGLIPVSEYMEDWRNLAHPENQQNIHATLTAIYKERKQQDEGYYIILDAHRWVRDEHVQRRILNIILSCNNNDRSGNKVLIFVSHTREIPDLLKPYIEVHQYGFPTDEEVVDCLSTLEKELGPSIPAGTAKGEFPESFLRECRGLNIYQLREAIYQAFTDDREITSEDLAIYRQGSLLKSNLMEQIRTPLSFEDVGGLNALKEWLDEAGDAFTPDGVEFGLPTSKGVLMVGVPGCGKSLAIKALANAWSLPLVKFDPSKLFEGRVGGSEANMHLALKQVEALGACILWVDEIEKAFAGMESSNYSDAGTTARVIGVFLTWMQEHELPVFVAATANNIRTLPAELVSRFEETFFVDLPDQDELAEIVGIHLDKYNHRAEGRKGFQLGRLAKAAEGGYTGREIDQSVREAMRKAFRSKGRKLTTKMIEDVIKAKPPIVQTMREQMDYLRTWVGFDPERQEGVRARFASRRKDREIEEPTQVARVLKLYADDESQED
jgi:AAA+ superfamily predicted ATPase